MKQLGRACLGALLAAPLAAQAADMAYLDVYYIPDSTLEFEGAGVAAVESDDGDGFGVKLAAMLGESLFLAGEYQSVDYTFADGTAKADTKRIGLGYKTPWPVYALGEYVRAEARDDDGESFDEDGWAAHLGIKANLFASLTLDARVGYQDVGDLDGLEYVVGLGLNLDRNFGLFADYRVSELEDDNGKTTAEDVRAGLRFRF
jgi:opacity protein-like surface antigen